MPVRTDRRTAENRLLGAFQDLVSEPGAEGIVGFARHIGLPLSTADGGKSWWPTFLAHYQDRTGRVDEERFANDFATFPPIVARVREIERQRPRGRA